MNEYKAIESRWKGGHNGIFVYIAYMRERIEQCYRVLKPTGSIFLHCDWHAVHYLKMMMDEIFGYNNFRNNIIWRRTSGHYDQTQWGRNADQILFYSKSSKYYFKKLNEPYTEDYLTKAYRYTDKKGRYSSDNITGAGVTKNDIKWKGYSPSEKGRHWAIPKAPIEKLVDKKKTSEMTTKEKLDLLYKEGYIEISSKGIPRYKRYLEKDKGTPLQEIWTDIYPVTSHSKERLGYPTQKPEALLNRIIKATTDKGDIVLDPFCGCGTALAVANKLSRRWIGIDISRTACTVMKKRLGGKVELIGGETEEELKKLSPHEFARYIIVERLGGILSPTLSGDMGIDGWVKFRTIPIQVKRWEHKVGRPEIDKFWSAVERAKKRMGYMVGFDFSRDAYNEVERIRSEHGMEIKLVTIKDVLEAKIEV